MADKKSRNLTVRPEGGMMRDLMIKIKLILRLMGDSRVNIFLKILPLAGLAYWILPLPFDNVVPIIDDAAAVWLSTVLFIELCPPEVVEDHMKKLSSNMDMVEGDDIVDGETTEIKDEAK
jgi:hypothetical protein